MRTWATCYAEVHGVCRYQLDVDAHGVAFLPQHFCVAILYDWIHHYNRSFETTKSAHSGHDVNPIPDYLIVGSDSGRIVVLEYDASNNVWKKLHQETFGKSGSRRIVPGQHLAVDPKGRSVMIGALEKSKL